MLLLPVLSELSECIRELLHILPCAFLEDHKRQAR
ncbi:hypothetical protein STLA111740_12795 [Stenotrophomonas lactitubi]